MSDRVTATEETASAEDEVTLLMRHSSPLVVSTTEDNAAPARSSNTPSPLRPSTRPRSNPRNRTPMRYESPLGGDDYRIPENASDARQITIRPMTAGRAVGTIAPTTRRGNRMYDEDRTEGTIRTKSKKQGPSHRKVRRWTNDNFVNLAAELQNSESGKAAARALVQGSAEAYAYKSHGYPSDPPRSKAMTEMVQNKDLCNQFFQEGLQPKPVTKPSTKYTNPAVPLSPGALLNRIEARLRRIVIKACQNSMPASQVVHRLEAFLIACFQGGEPDSGDWTDLLLETPKINGQGSSCSVTFLFGADSSTGGFHRLLLHGVCQFHGLNASSSTEEVHILDQPRRARVLTAKGDLLSPDMTLVDCVMSKGMTMNSVATIDRLSATLGTLQV